MPKILSKLANLLQILAWCDFKYKIINFFDFNKPILQP